MLQLFVGSFKKQTRSTNLSQVNKKKKKQRRTELIKSEMNKSKDLSKRWTLGAKITDEYSSKIPQ
jgi:hypothetical protein